MLFSIVIPAYKAANTIHLTLSSLLCQIFKDFEVIVVDDNSPEMDFLDMVQVINKFQRYMDLKVITRDENGGCGPTLQTGLDAAKGDYFIPIDADDIFATAESLLHFTRIITANNYPDAVCTAFMEYDENGRMTLIDQNNSAFVHGKCYKIQYLRENNITFPNEKWFEDGSFNFLALNLTQHIIRDPMVTYLWQANPNSITRSQDYNVLVMPFYVNAYLRAFPRLKERDTRTASFFMSGILAYGYYYWNSFKRRGVDQKELDNLIELIRGALEETQLIENINNDRGIFDEYCKNDSRAKGMIEGQEGGFVVSMDLNSWLKHYFNKKIDWLEV